MALLTTLNKTTYTAAAGQTTFAYSFKIYLTTDLEVYVNNVLQTSGYTVTGAGSDSGGNVVFDTGRTAGDKVLIVRVEPPTQASTLPASGPFPSSTVEKMSDKLTMLIQQLQEVDTRALKLAITSVFANLALPDPQANKVLRWKATLDGLENVDVTGQGAITLPIGVTDGGTGGTTIQGARANLKIASQASIASAATLPVTEDSYQLVSGSTGITALATQQVGTIIALRFTGAPLITHNATSLILLGAVNYQAAAGDIMVFVSEGSGNWREIWRRPVTGATSANFFRGDGIFSALPASVTAPQRGYLFGLTLSNNGVDAINDLDIAVGEAASDDAAVANRELMELTSAFTKQLDAAWVVGTAAGMRDTGAIADGTWHIFLIKRTDTGVVDVLASLSATAPTMPTNYNKKRRIGAIIRTAGSILGFVQDGDSFWYKTPPALDFDVTNPGTAAVTRTVATPAGVKVIALLNIETFSSSIASALYLSDLDVTDVAASTSASPLGQTAAAGVAGALQINPAAVRTNASAQIRTRVSASDANTVIRCATIGWRDSRGKNN